jgi:hypothetical protein
MTGDHRMFLISPAITTPPPNAQDIRILQTIVGVCSAALLIAAFALYRSI